jgi:hypothetical protein
LKIIKIDRVEAELLTFEDGTQKIAFNIPKSDQPPRLRISSVINLLGNLKINNFEAVARKQYTAIKGKSGRKIALYIVEGEKGLAISMHKAIATFANAAPDSRFPSTSRNFIESEEELIELFHKIGMELEDFLNAYS